jgi:DNA-binding MarR family transcriptional regulator
LTEPQAPKSAKPLVGALLRQAHHDVREQVLQDVRKAGFEDITAAHLAVFQHPSPEGQRPIDLARRLGVTKQALNYLLRQLQDHGYLARDDGGASTIKLTKRGRALTESARAAVLRVEATWSTRLGAARYRAFREALEKLTQAPIKRGS